MGSSDQGFGLSLGFEVWVRGWGFDESKLFSNNRKVLQAN